MLASSTESLMLALRKLDEKRMVLAGTAEAEKAAIIARDEVLPAMNECRTYADKLESIMAGSDWPMPSYAELMWTH